MHWGVFLTIFILAFGGVAQAGLCVQSTTTPLASVRCTFPNCPTGMDCLAPEIDRKSASVTYLEPLLKWMDACPSREVSSASCWEAYLEFRLKVAASDPSGVAAVGASVAVEVGNKRVFRKYWQQVGAKDADGKYEMIHTMTLHIPAGQTLDVQIQEVCARDSKTNEACFVPSKLPNLALRGE